jgi:nucleotide-binding universal stress UspA family protein
MFSSLIVPVDESPASGRGATIADQLAALTGAAVDLVVVRAPQMEAGQDEALLDRMAQFVTSAPGRRLAIAADDASDAILELQLTTPGSLVCVGTHGRTGATEIVLGSMANDLLRRSNDPLLLVGPRVEWANPRGPVLACTDGSTLADTVLGAATEWANELDATVWLTTVEPRELVVASMEGAPLARLAARAAQTQGMTLQWDVLHGDDVAETIATRARDQDAGVIAMTSHPRAGLRERLLGSVALRVVHDAPCPVLVVPV